MQSFAAAASLVGFGRESYSTGSEFLKSLNSHQPEIRQVREDASMNPDSATKRECLPGRALKHAYARWVDMPPSVQTRAAASLRTTLACFLPMLACFWFLFGMPAFAQKPAP